MYHGHKNDLSLLERLLEFCLWTWLFGRWQRNSQLPNKAVICIFNIVSASVKKLEKIYSSSYSIFCYSVTKSCPTHCDPMNCSTPGSSVFHYFCQFAQIHVESVMLSNLLIHCYPFSSFPQSFPASWSFPVSQFFASGVQSIGASSLTSVFPMPIQGWFL